MLESSRKFWNQREKCERRDFLRAAGMLGLGLAARRLSGASAYALPLGGAQEQPMQATLKVDLDRRLGTIDPNIYGNFIEHLGRCIYGGIFDEGSPLADADGNRKDVLDAVRKLRVTQLRWPGGNFSSGYHWQDGIGPKGARPARYDLAWFARESNRYGTDEFISTCRKLGTTPYICVNLGTGTVDEASSWIEYCNREGGTYYSDLRKKNGHPEPYAVKYWGVGNEIYGDWQIGHKTAAEYARAGLEFAKAMKWQDPSIKLIACGNGDPSWDRPVLEAMVNHVDYISAHHYTVSDDAHDYYDVLGSVAQLEQLICNSALVAESVSARARKPTPVWTALDEWNIINNWSDASKRDDAHKFDLVYNLRDALWVATALNCIQRHCRTVRMANLAQLVNVIAPMQASPAGLLLTTIFYPLELYANRSGSVALDVLVESPRFETKRFADQPYLNVAATCDEAKRKVTLAVVNRRKEGDITGNIEFAGKLAKPGARAFQITGPSPEAMNTFADPHAVVREEVRFEGSGNRLQYQFPRHSISWLEFEMSH